MDAADRPEDVEGVEIVSSDARIVGEVTAILWRDRSGFDVLAVETSGEDVVLPVLHQELTPGGTIHIDYSSNELRTAPRVTEIGTKIDQPLIDLVGEHYNVALNGPPPGPGTTKLPPWWKRKRGRRR